MSTEITVRGSFAAFERPERGTVHATIAYDGPAMEPVYGRVARDLDAVKASIAPLDNKDNGPVTWWSADQLRTWSNSAMEQRRQAASARAPRQRRFRGEVSGLRRAVPLGRRACREHRGIPRCTVEWALTAKRLEALQKEVRTRAVRDAVTTRAGVRRRARARPDSAGRHRRRRDARHATRKWSFGGLHAGRGRWRSAGRGARAAAHRGVGGGRRALRCRDRLTRPGVAFASWRNSKTGCVQT